MKSFFALVAIVVVIMYGIYYTGVILYEQQADKTPVRPPICPPPPPPSCPTCSPCPVPDCPSLPPIPTCPPLIPPPTCPPEKICPLPPPAPTCAPCPDPPTCPPPTPSLPPDKSCPQPPTCPPPSSSAPPTPPSVLPSDPTFPTNGYFYEFCNPEKVFNVTLPSINKTVWFLNYEDTFDPTKIVFNALYEDNEMIRPKSRIQVLGHPDTHLVKIEIYDKAQKQYLKCDLVAAWDQNEIICPKSPADSFKRDVETLYLRVSDVNEKVVTLMIPVCKRIQPPLHTLTLCVAFLHVRPNLTERLVEFIEYHRMIGFNHIIFYARDEVYRRNLTSVYPPHVLSLVPWPGVAHNVTNLMKRFQGYYDQQVALSHCLYNQRRRSEWLALWDYDEWLVIRKNDTQGKHVSLLSLLNTDPMVALKYVERLEFATKPYNSSFLVVEQFTTERNYTPRFQKPIVKPWHTLKSSVHLAQEQPPYTSGRLNFTTEARLLHFMNINSIRSKPAMATGNNTEAQWALPELKTRVKRVVNAIISQTGAESIDDVD